MRQRLLDTTPITVVGCGDVRLATAASRGIDAREVEHAVHHALELGIRFVDVADEPDAERLCGDAIRTLRLRDSVVLAARVPMLAPLPGRPNRDVLPERLPTQYVQTRVEAALRASRLDALPLVQLALRPEWRASAAWPELAGTCARLVREGKVMRWAAYLDAFTDDADSLTRDTWLVAISVPYSACDRTAAPLLATNTPILARSPLAGGALAGTIGPGVRLTLRDDRSEIDDRTLERIAAAVATLSRLVSIEPAAARSCEAAKAALELTPRTHEVEASTLAELALRYVCDRAIALPRLHRRQHQHLADAITAASAPPLSQSVRDRIDEVLANQPPE